MPLSGAAKNLQTTTGVVNVGLAAAPSANQVLTATSATAATWQTASGGTSRFVISTRFEAAARLANTGVTPTINSDGGGWVTTTGATSTSSSIIDTGLAATNAKVFVGNPLIAAWIAIFPASTLSAQAYVGLGEVTVDGTAGLTMTINHFGFYYTRSSGTMTMKATNANGTTQTTTTGTTLGTSTHREIVCAQTDTTNIKFYENGTLLATSTTNLPLATTAIGSCGQVSVTNTNSASSEGLYVANYQYSKNIVY